MTVALWIVAGLPAVAFLGVGGMRLTGEREQRLTSMPSVVDLMQSQVKAIGALEVLGGPGLVVPAIAGIAPVVVPAAVTGLALLMAGAVVVHVRRGDGVVAVGRFGPAAF